MVHCLPNGEVAATKDQWAHLLWLHMRFYECAFGARGVGAWEAQGLGVIVGRREGEG